MKYTFEDIGITFEPSPRKIKCDSCCKEIPKDQKRIVSVVPRHWKDWQGKYYLHLGCFLFILQKELRSYIKLTKKGCLEITNILAEKL